MGGAASMVECRDRVFLKRRAACAPAATAGVKRRRRGASPLRHPGLAQTGEVGSFVQGTDFWHTEIKDSLRVGDAQETTAAAQPPGFSEFGGSAFAFAFEGVGG